ncbi:MAG: Paraquat-inducible protein B, partial [uncultured Acetobacteraceae bacterium]
APTAGHSLRPAGHRHPGQSALAPDRPRLRRALAVQPGRRSPDAAAQRRGAVAPHPGGPLASPPRGAGPRPRQPGAAV